MEATSVPAAESGAAAERRRSVAMAHRFEAPIMIAALLLIPVVVIESVANKGSGWRTAATVLNWTIWSAFLLEVLVMLAVVPDRRGWLKSHPLDVAIVVLTPPFLPAGLQAGRFLRLLRLLRLIRMAQILRRVFSFDGLRDAAFFTMLTALVGGVAFSALEEGYNSWDGVWWALVTMTTVGYGDVSPHTTAGRILGIVVMFVGIGFIALLTGSIAQRFISQQVRQVEEAEREIAATETDVLHELREVMARLQGLERRLERMAQRNDAETGRG